MKYKKIKLKNNKSILIDESAEIKEGELVIQDGGLNRIGIGTHQASIAYTIKPLKIVATINHSISLDVPMVIVKDKVEEVCESEYKRHPNNDLLYGDDKYKILAYKAGVYDGFKAKQKGVYSEEDLIGFSKWIEKEELPFEDGSFVKYFNGKDNYLTVSQVMQMYIQSLKQKYIELEMEEILGDEGIILSLDNKDWKIKTNRVDGQLMAYLKS